MESRIPLHRIARFWAFAVLMICASLASAAKIEVQGAMVRVNGMPIVTFKTKAVDGTSPTKRAQYLAGSLKNLPYLGDVSSQKVGKTYAIFVAGKRVVTVTPAEAKSHKSTPAALAVSWAANMKSAFAVPALKAETENFKMPAPSVKSLRVAGYEFGAAKIFVSNPSFRVEKVAGALKITASEAGGATVTIQGPKASQSIQVVAAPYAAVLPQTLTARVTGSPAHVSTVQGAIEGAIRTQLSRTPDAKIEIVRIVPAQVSSGESKTFTAKIKVDSPTAYVREGNVSVVVRNEPIVYRREDALWYSNHPENVRETGALFSSPLERTNGARLLYHHINQTAYGMFLRVQVLNDSDQPAKVILMPGDATPDKNPVRAGLRAAEMYFRAWGNGSGEIVTIPPRSTLPISLRRMAPQETVSGLCGIYLVEGPDRVVVRTDALPPLTLAGNWSAAVQSPTPWRFVGCNPINDYDATAFSFSDHVYPNPFKQGDLKYEVGKRFGFFKIGERAISGTTNGQVLDGNFGVIYSIAAEAVNPTSSPIEIEVVFEASAGYSGALFYVNGSLKETPLLQPKAEYRIERFRLGPGESKKLDLVTVPLSGSSYPALISMRPLQDLSTGVAGSGR